MAAHQPPNDANDVTNPNLSPPSWDQLTTPDATPALPPDTSIPNASHSNASAAYASNDNPLRARDLLRVSADGRCTAHSKQSLKRCSKPAITGGAVCVYHGGKAPQVQAAARKRILEMVAPAIDRLNEIVEFDLHITDRDGNERINDKVLGPALVAIKDILDRAGLKPADKLELVEPDEGDPNRADLTLLYDYQLDTYIQLREITMGLRGRDELVVPQQLQRAGAVDVTPATTTVLSTTSTPADEPTLVLPAVKPTSSGPKPFSLGE